MGGLTSSASVQWVFCWSSSTCRCISTVSVGRKVISTSYSSAILPLLPRMTFLLRNSGNGQEELVHPPISATVSTVLLDKNATVRVEILILKKPLPRVHQHTHVCWEWAIILGEIQARAQESFHSPPTTTHAG